MQDEEVGVSLKDVLVYCFLHWRSAIVVVLVGAILGGGYYGLKSRPASTPAAVEEAEEELSTDEGVLYALDSQRENLAQLSGYLESSLLMRIDPNNEYVSRATLLISAPSQTSSQMLDALVSHYVTGLTTTPALDDLADEMGTTSAFLRELISTERGDIEQINNFTGGESSASTTVIQQQDDTLGARAATLTVTVIGSTEEEASSIRDALLSELDGVHDDAMASIAAHNLSVASQQDFTTVDYALLQRQVERANAVSSAQTTLTNNEKNAPSEETVAAAASTGISKRALLKGALLSGVAAFLLYGFVLCLRYVLDGSPVMRGQVEARYALPEVGSYAYGAEAFYRGTTGFDRWLRRLSGLEDAPEPAAVAEMVAANVRLYAEGAQTVLVSSSVASERAAELVEALSVRLDDRTVALANDLVSSPGARTQLKAADAVLFVEEYGTSTYESIDAEITLASETGKSPLGLVMA